MVGALSDLAYGIPWDDLPRVLVRAYEEIEQLPRPDLDVELRIAKMMYINDWFKTIDSPSCPMMSEVYLESVSVEYNWLNQHHSYVGQLHSHQEENYSRIMDDQCSLEQAIKLIDHLSRDLLRSIESEDVAPIILIKERTQPGDFDYMDKLDIFVYCFMRLVKRPALVEIGAYDEILELSHSEDLRGRYDKLMEMAEEMANTMITAALQNRDIESIEAFSELCREDYLDIDHYIHLLGEDDYRSFLRVLKRGSSLEERGWQGSSNELKLFEVSFAILGLYRSDYDEIKSFLMSRDDFRGICNYVMLYLSSASLARYNPEMISYRRAPYHSENIGNTLSKPIINNEEHSSFNNQYALYRYHLERLKPSRAKSARS